MIDFVVFPGERFGSLTAESYVGGRVWLLRCDCGNRVERSMQSLRQSLVGFHNAACDHCDARGGRHALSFSAEGEMLRLQVLDELQSQLGPVRYERLVEDSYDPESDLIDMIDHREALPELLRKHLSDLSERSASVMRLRFFEEKTLAEAAELLGITRERVRQIEKRALRRMRGRWSLVSKACEYCGRLFGAPGSCKLCFEEKFRADFSASQWKVINKRLARERWKYGPRWSHWDALERKRKRREERNRELERKREWNRRQELDQRFWNLPPTRRPDPPHPMLALAPPGDPLEFRILVNATQDAQDLPETAANAYAMELVRRAEKLEGRGEKLQAVEIYERAYYVEQRLFDAAPEREVRWRWRLGLNIPAILRRISKQRSKDFIRKFFGEAPPSVQVQYTQMLIEMERESET